MEIKTAGRIAWLIGGTRYRVLFWYAVGILLSKSAERVRWGPIVPLVK